MTTDANAEFPIICETCLGENPFLRMTKEKAGRACDICECPMTAYRFRPGPKARYKKTVVCRSCSKMKNVCQVCVLDLQYGVPVQVRDAALAEHEKEDMSTCTSQVNMEYKLEGQQMDGDASTVPYNKFTKPNKMLERLAARAPYYKRNLPKICSFYVKGECNRGVSCPYRHVMPTTGELANQNVKDRYFGNNDPVALKMMRLAKERSSALSAPEDKSIRTLWVGGLDPMTTQESVRRAFSSFGAIASVTLLSAKKCAFVAFSSRAAAEEAATKLYRNLSIDGSRCRLAWGKKKASKGGASKKGARAPPGVKLPPGMTAPPGSSASFSYSSMNPNSNSAKFASGTEVS